VSGPTPERSTTILVDGARPETPPWHLRLIGALILLLTLAPAHWLLQQPGTGRFGESAVMRNASNLGMAWWGILLAVGLGAALSILIPTKGIRVLLARLGRTLSSPPLPVFALALGSAATALALLAGVVLFQGLPTLVDGMVTRLQARAMAGGLLALELPDPMAAWLIPNTILTPEGWVSQYPPFPALLLAVGELLAVPWLVFPLLVGGTVTITTLLADRLFPEEPTLVRLGGVLLALSPFLLFLGGGYLSHVPAAAFTALTLYATLRALEGRWEWAILVGVGSGAVVTSRPLLGLVLGVALPVAYWVAGSLRRRGLPWLFSRLSGGLLGGAPFALGLGLYNRHFFGHPTRLGYSAAFGPSHDLGFHTDPWGNLYSPLEALGFTAVDLTGLGAYLLETPIPATALVGAFLLLSPRVPRGAKYLLSWALLPVLANAVYWHHGFHLGPRMLYEAAPAWILLSAVAAVALAKERIPEGPPPGEPDPGEEGKARAAELPNTLRGGSTLARFRLPELALWSLLVSILGACILLPNRIAAYRWSPETLARITVPHLPTRSPALVFVHGSWSERISSRLQASGMRLDSIETALRRNDICALHTYAFERESEPSSGPPSGPGGAGLDFQLLAETPPHLQTVYLTEGNRILVDPERPVTPQCQREARADGFGIISLAPLLWQGDLPGLEEGRPIFVRDLGPEENRRIMEAFPDRRPYLLMTPAPDSDPEVREYGEGMGILWGEGSP